MKDLAYGCVFGSFIGDACGSYLEFIEDTAEEHEMIECMKMPGGGSAWDSIGPGQITDDGELTLCLL